MDEKQDEHEHKPEPIEPGHVMCAKKWKQIKDQLVPQQK